MIGEVIRPYFEFLARGEEFIFAASHRSDSAWDIFPHGLRDAVGKIKDVDALLLFILVDAASGVENVREGRRKRQRVHDSVALTDRGDGLFDLHFAAVVAGFADQQQDSQAAIRFLFQQIYLVVHCVEDHGPAVPRLEICEVGGDHTCIPREISGEIHSTVELDHSDSRGSQAKEWVQHRLQPLDTGELIIRAASALDGHDQRNRLPLRRFIKAHFLSRAIVLHDDVLGLESIHDSALLIFDQRWNQHDGGL